MRGNFRIAGCVGIIGCWLAGAGIAAAQGTAPRSVGIGGGVDTGFHGTLGTKVLDTFASRSFGLSARSRDVNIAPLSSAGATALGRRSVGGLADQYRLSGETAGGGGLTQRYSTSPFAQNFGAIPNFLPARGRAMYGTWQGENLFAAGLAGATGQPDPQAAWRRPETPPSNSQASFDLDKAVKNNAFFSRAIQLIRAGQPDEAVQEIRLGVIFAPGQAEGEWLMAVAMAAAGDDGQAIYRLGNALRLYPPLLGQVHRAGELIGDQAADRRIEAAEKESAAGASTESALVTAWLCVDGGRTDRARAILEAVGLPSGAAVAVADALVQAVQPQSEVPPPPAQPANASPTASPASADRPAAAANASLLPPISYRDWAGQRSDPLMGLSSPVGRLVLTKVEP